MDDLGSVGTTVEAVTQMADLGNGGTTVEAVTQAVESGVLTTMTTDLGAFVRDLSLLVGHCCNFLAIVIISIGIIKATIIFFKDALLGSDAGTAIVESRREMGHALSLGLGFLIGSSILKTTIMPTWNDIGQLASIIAIRTTLNYFLLKDIRRDEETRLAAQEQEPVPVSTESESKK